MWCRPVVSKEFVYLLFSILVLNVSSMPHFAERFHEVLSQSIGFRVLWTDNNSFHVHLVFVAVRAVEWRSSISFDGVRKPMR